jgi:hypothetical protein
MVTLAVNGKTVDVDVDDPATPLLYALRNDLALHGPRFGCGLGQCGACTVHIDGRAVRSCVYPVGAVGQGKVTTLEGLGSVRHPHPLQHDAAPVEWPVFNATSSTSRPEADTRMNPKRTHGSEAVLLRRGRVDHRPHARNDIGRKASVVRVLPHHLHVRRNVDAVDLIVRHVAFNPLDLRAQASQHVARLL